MAPDCHMFHHSQACCLHLFPGPALSIYNATAANVFVSSGLDSMPPPSSATLKARQGCCTYSCSNGPVVLGVSSVMIALKKSDLMVHSAYYCARLGLLDHNAVLGQMGTGCKAVVELLILEPPPHDHKFKRLECR